MSELPPIAVLLMAMGGPDSLESVEPYLLDVRGGRPTPPELVEEIRERYRASGGKSPVLDITRELAGKLEGSLNRPGLPPVRVFVGLRHWQPRIAEAWAEVMACEPQRVVAICLAPHYSTMTVGKYLEKLDEAREAIEGGDIPLSTVGSWSTHPRLIAALADTVVAGLEHFPEEVRGDVPVLFTAHSLPERILAEGDPYPDEVRATMDAVCRRLDETGAGAPAATRFAYQSQGRSAEPWLGPEVETVLSELAEAGHQHVLVAPIGFLSDHVEINYDIDIEFRDLAEKLGLRLERTPMLNATDPLVHTLAALVDEHLAEAP